MIAPPDIRVAGRLGSVHAHRSVLAEPQRGAKKGLFPRPVPETAPIGASETPSQPGHCGNSTDQHPEFRFVGAEIPLVWGTGDLGAIGAIGAGGRLLGETGRL